MPKDIVRYILKVIFFNINFLLSLTDIGINKLLVYIIYLLCSVVVNRAWIYRP